MELLKEYGPYMDDNMWNAAISDLFPDGAKNNTVLDFMTMGRKSMKDSESAAAEVTYIDGMIALEKELFAMIYQERGADGEGGNLSEATEFTTMFYQVADQMKRAMKPGDSLSSVSTKMNLAKDRLLGAYGQWENYNRYQAGNVEDVEAKAFYKPWTWFTEKLPAITTPMVFFEGMHGLIDGGGANVIPLDPEKKPMQYQKATLALYFLKGLESDYQKNQEIQKDIYKKWSKEEKGQGGSFNSIDNYPDYFYAEVYKMFNARNKKLLSQ